MARIDAAAARPRRLPDFKRERQLIRAGMLPVAGVDEVGRGPLAGPVVAAAVILDPSRIPRDLDDSKLISAARREALFDIILATADVAVASVSASRIDSTDIRQAALEAMRRALNGLVRRPAYVLVDGRDMPAWPGAGEAVVKGDRLVASIAAASIVAKVTRDRMMTRLALTFPAYGFDRHAGYPTPNHRAAIRRHGPCPFHRLTFGSVSMPTLTTE
jgi:ribonuclease HII